MIIENMKDINIWQMSKRVGLKPHEQERITVDLYHRPGLVVAAVRNKNDRIPLGVDYARKNPNVTAGFEHLERLAIKRALTKALPLIRVL
jgi:hypothetical protein